MSCTHLLYLHGFRSSPQSTKAQITLKAVGQRYPATQVLCPALAPSPKRAMQALESALAGWPTKSMAIIGSSLGGFYATYLAERYGCKAVVLNPAVFPARDLSAHLGDQQVWQDPSSHFVFERRYLDELVQMEVKAITHAQRYLAVIAKGDELLDWREMAAHYALANTVLLDGSDHALSDYTDHLDTVLNFVFN